jgi:hypothetical protein
LSPHLRCGSSASDFTSCRFCAVELQPMRQEWDR